MAKKQKTARDIVRTIRMSHGRSDLDRSAQAEYFEDSHEIYNALLDFVDEYELTEELENFLSCNIIEDNR